MTAEGDIFRHTFETIVKADPTILAHVSKAQDDLSPLTVLRLFQKISAEDCEVMGLDPEKGRPEPFMWTALPVPPSPWSGNASNEDDLTVLLSPIVQTNFLIEKMLADAEENYLEHWDWLQISMDVDSDLPGIPHKIQGAVRKIKIGLVQRLRGKNGRIRGDLSGKRVDNSGRTVILPDPNCRIDQMAVPMRMVMKLMYLERVTAFNIETLYRRILNGNTFTISVLMHLNDGDIVLFNLQPSLHKLSIMSHSRKTKSVGSSAFAATNIQGPRSRLEQQLELWELSQSESGTQMTLKTFHFAGVASMNVTLGVPRIKEIINASKSISTPHLEDKLRNSEKSARVVKGRIEKTTHEDVRYVGSVARATVTCLGGR
ncbi:hypothetical protein BJ742DRAFT_738466 [Cladochytrium replicatum]|nr:hypothetical protein BJ742DRAFT_738466 [Cladochytrium replicatum]